VFDNQRIDGIKGLFGFAVGLDHAQNAALFGGIRLGQGIDEGQGQFLFLESSDSIFYFGSPWITDVEDLGLIGLSIPDFAIHDTITDNLQLLKSKEIVNDDMKRIADELIEQRNALIEKNNEVVELAKFPNQNPLPILRISFDGQLLYANQIAKEKFEINEFLEFLRDSNFYVDHVAGNVKPSEYQIKLNDRLYQVSIVPFQNSFYYNLYFNDVTEQDMYQKELLRTNSRLETLISSMQSALVAEDSERKIILVNQKFCDLFEIPVQPNLLKGLDCTDAAESSKHLFSNEEGFVITYYSGFKFKLKGEAYCKIHRMLSNLTPLAFWRALNLELGMIPSDYLEALPEEFRKHSDFLKETIEDLYNKRLNKVIEIVDKIFQMSFGSTRERYEFLSKLYPREATCVLNILNGKLDKVQRDIHREIRPSGNSFKDIELDKDLKKIVENFG
jgi:PAS domain-containing protein